MQDWLTYTLFPEKQVLYLAPRITETAPPTETELKILREEVDPHRYVIGR